MVRLILSLICSVLGLVLLSCGGGGNSEPTPQPELTTPSGGPTATADAQPATATPETPAGFQHLEGETMAFDYPADWNVWSKSFNGVAERIVISNIPVQPEIDALPEGGIKIAFESPGSSGPALPLTAAQETMTVGPDAIPFGLFPAGSGAVGRWSLRGAISKGERAYYAFAEINTEEPDLDLVTPILETWTLKG